MAVIRTALVMSVSLSAPIGLVTVAPMVLEGPLVTGAPVVQVAKQHERRQLSQLGYAGKRLFLRDCVQCHGQDAKGSQRAGGLVAEPYHSENFGKRSFHQAVRGSGDVRIASASVSHSFPKLSFNQVEQLERYIRELQKPFDFQ